MQDKDSEQVEAMMNYLRDVRQVRHLLKSG